MLMVKNIIKFLEGLKVLFFELFILDEVRLLFFKGRIIVVGGESVGL